MPFPFAPRLFPLLLLFLLPAAALAQFTYTSSNNEITITGYTGPGGAVTIPSTIDGLPVSSIGESAFQNRTGVTSVTIPNSVTGIGDQAFYLCTGLTSVTIGNSVTSIGRSAFAECTSLASLTIPDSVTSIAGYAFHDCNSLSAITVEALNTSYSSAEGVLFNKSQTTLVVYPGGKTGSYSIPNSVTTIGEGSFYACTNLASLTIGANVTSIGYAAFYNCARLISLTIPNSVTTIAGEAFSHCSSLASVMIGNSVISIGGGAFVACTSLASVVIGNSVTTIGWHPFSFCSSLSAITVAALNTSFSSVDGVLFNKSQTTLVVYPAGKTSSYTIPDGVTSIGEGAFSSCANLTGVYFQGNAPLFVGEFVFISSDNVIVYYLPGTTGWGENFADRPTAVWKPQIQAFSPTLGMQEGRFGFTISWASDQTIVVEACAELSVALWIPIWTNTLAADFTYFTDPDTASFPSRIYRVRPEHNQFNYTIQNGQVSITAYIGDADDVTIPDIIQGLPVTRIADNAFFQSRFTSLTVGANVTSIGLYAFQACGYLTNVTLGASVTHIEEGAFLQCTSLGSITIPQSVTHLGRFPFAYCSGLRAITVEPLNTAFSSLDGVLFSKNQTTLLTYPGGKGGSYAIPNTVTNIGDFAFRECYTLESVTIPSSITGIGHAAFLECASLTTVTIPNGLINIGGFAFSDCSALTNVTIPNSVLTIGMAAFVRCTGLTSIAIPANVTSFGEYMFEGCSSLTAILVDPFNPNYSSDDGVMFNKNKTTLLYCPGGKTGSYTIPQGVTMIRGHAFDRCFSLTTVTVPSSVTSIEDFAFYYCSGLQRVYFAGNPPEVGGPNVFGLSSPTIYHLPGAAGWGATFADRPTALWN